MCTCGTLLICSSACPQGTSSVLPVNDYQLREAGAPALCRHFHACVTVAFKPGPASLALLLTRSNRRADQRPFLDRLCDHFSCVCLTLTLSFPHMVYSPFLSRVQKKVKSWSGWKNPTWPVCVCLSVCVCLAHKQYRWCPLLQMKRLFLTTTRKVET